MNIWNFLMDIYSFILSVYDKFMVLWESSFGVGDYTIYFKDVLTTSLILIVGLILVKKLIPVA